MSNLQTEQFREMVLEARQEIHKYSDFCQCHLCQDMRELRESDDYDLSTCNLV